MEWSAKSIMVLLVLYTLLVMVFVLLSRKQKQLSDKFLILYAAVEILGFTRYFSAIFKDQLFLGFPQYYFITVPVCYTYIPLFYLYFLSNFKAGFNFNKKHLFHFAFFMLYFLYYCIRYLPKPIGEVQQLILTRPQFIQVEWLVHEITLNIQYVIYSALLIVATKDILKNKKGEKKRPFVFIVLIGYLLGILLSLVFTFLFVFGVNTTFDAAFWGIMYFYAFFVFLFFITIRKIESDRVKTDQKHILIEVTKARELEMYVFNKVKEQALYLDPLLTLSDCAQKLNLGAKEFSFLLNHHINENFNEYINRFRIERAKEMLIQYPDRSVQEIMYGSGFNSKAVFYAAFKRQTNISPGDFRKKNLEGPGK